MRRRVTVMIVAFGAILVGDLIVANSSDAGGFGRRWSTGRAGSYNYYNYYAPSPTTMNRQPRGHYEPQSLWYTPPTSYYYDTDYGPRPPGVAPY